MAEEMASAPMPTHAKNVMSAMWLRVSDVKGSSGLPMRARLMELDVIGIRSLSAITDWLMQCKTVSQAALYARFCEYATFLSFPQPWEWSSHALWLSEMPLSPNPILP